MPKKSRPRTKFLTKSELLAAKALANYKPRKSHAGQFVHVGLNGKPLPKSSPLKGVFVYVRRDRRGRLHADPVREKPRQKITARSSAGYDLTRNSHKQAIDRYYRGKSTSTRKVRMTKMTPSEKRGAGVNFNRFARKLAIDLRIFANTFRSRGTFLIDLSVIVRMPNGSLRTFNDTVQFNQHELQNLTLGQVEKFVKTEVYGVIAENLKDHDLVSAGSAAHIRSLKINRQEFREDWLDRSGQPWEKHDLDVVKIVRIEYQLKRIGK